MGVELLQDNQDWKHFLWDEAIKAGSRLETGVVLIIPPFMEGDWRKPPLPCSRVVVGWYTLVQALQKKKKRTWFVMFTHFHGVNILTMADFKWPTWCHWTRVVKRCPGAHPPPRSVPNTHTRAVRSQRAGVRIIRSKIIRKWLSVEYEYLLPLRLNIIYLMMSLYN